MMGLEGCCYLAGVAPGDNDANANAEPLRTLPCARGSNHQ